jgi:Cu2+-exporting ATPase
MNPALNRADLHRLDGSGDPSATVIDDPIETARFTRWVDRGEGQGREGVSSLQLSGMHCAACAGLIEQALGRVPGVLEATVSAAAQRATVRWDPQRTRPTPLRQHASCAGASTAWRCGACSSPASARCR